MLGNTDAADRTAGPCDLDRGLNRLIEPDALEHRVNPEPAGEFLDPLDRLAAAFGDDVGGAELAGERDPVRVSA